MGVQKSFSQEVLFNLDPTGNLSNNMISIFLLSLFGMSSAQYFYRPSGYSHASFVSPSHSYSWGVGNSFASVRRGYSPRVVAPTFAARTSPVLPSDVDTSSPSAKAAIAYIGETLGLDTCGEAANAYIKTLENGGSAEDAGAAATSLYRVNYFARGANSQASAACKAAEAAYKSSFSAGRDPVTAAAEAYISASEAFASATAADARARKTTIDARCAKAAAAYASACAISSPAGNAALNAFVAKALETGNGFDAGCASAADKFIESYSSGETVAALQLPRSTLVCM